jgi:hypothetical protein
MADSFTEQVSFIKMPYKKNLTYTHPYSHLYTAGGQNGLVDGLYGEPNAFGNWQGFFGDDFEVVVDLGDVRKFKTIEASFLQQYPSWIWLPKEVEFAVSSDGTEFKNVYFRKNFTPLNEPGSFIQPFTATLKETYARFVKVVARNIKTCPEWHPGAGEKAWIFIDEIKIE